MLKALALLFAVLLIAGCGSQPAAPKAESLAAAEVSFAKDIQPMFSRSCMPCHAGSADSKSPYVLTNYGGVMGTGKDSVPNVCAGNADSSLVCQLLKAGKMPPTDPLSPAQVELVNKWVAQGAKNN